MLYRAHQLEQFLQSSVLGISLGFRDPAVAQYVGFILLVITGIAAGNIFGQISLFWSKIAPYNSKEGLIKGMIIGMALLHSAVCSTCHTWNST